MLKFTSRWVVLLVMGGGLIFADRPLRADDKPQTSGVVIGVVQGLFADTPPAMIKVLGRPLREMIDRETGVTGDFLLVKDAVDLADSLNQNKCQLAVFHGFEFAWAKARHPDLVPLVVTVPPAQKLQALVVVHAESKVQSIADLKDQSVMVPRGTRSHCLAYLNKQRQGLSATTAEPSTKSGMTVEDALDAVVGSEASAALVDVSGFIGYQKLQPGAVKNLRVLCESERFPQNVIAYNKSAITPETAAQLRKCLMGAHTTPGGKPLMMLWNIKGFDEIPPDYVDQLDKIAKAYPPPAKPGAGSPPNPR